MKTNATEFEKTCATILIAEEVVISENSGDREPKKAMLDDDLAKLYQGKHAD